MKIKAVHYTLLVGFLVIVMGAFNCSCRSVRKSQKAESLEAVVISKKDSVVAKESTSKSTSTAKLFKQLVTDKSKTKTTTKQTIIEQPVFDSTGKIKSAASITYVGVVEDQETDLSGLSTDSSTHVSNDSTGRIRAVVSSRDSAAVRTITSESSKRVFDNQWLLWLLLVALVLLCWWKRGWIIEKIVTFFT